MKLRTIMFTISVLALFSCNRNADPYTYHIPDYSYTAGIEDTTTATNDSAGKASLAQSGTRTRDGLIQVYVHNSRSPKEKIAESSVSAGLRQSILQDIISVVRMLSGDVDKQ